MTTEEQDKLNALYRLYEQPMYRIAYAILHQSEQAEDAVSEAFLRVIQNLKKIKAIDSKQTQHYMVQIIRSTAINQYRKNQRDAERYTIWDDTILQVPSQKDDMEQLLTNMAQQQTITDLLEPLCDLDKKIVLLRCQDELSFREIATLLSLKETAVRKRFERAIKRIRKQKGDMLYETNLFPV